MRRSNVFVALAVVFGLTSKAVLCGRTSTFAIAANETTSELDEAKLDLQLTENGEDGSRTAPENVFGNMVASMERELLRYAVSTNFDELNVSPKCANHLFMTLKGLKQMNPWALRMFDASGKLPNGLFQGTFVTFGDYDGCVNVDINGLFKGQHCAVSILFPHPSVEATGKNEDNTTSKPNPYDVVLTGFKTSLCLPSTCTREEIERIGAKVANDTHLGIGVQVPHCEVKEASKFETVDIVILFCFSSIILLAICGTLLDTKIRLSKEDNGSGKDLNLLARILLCFSVYTNTKKLLRKDDSPDSIKIFHGIRVISAFWVFLGHNYSFFDLDVIGSIVNAANVIATLSFEVILNGYYCVETFFFISGVLIVYTRMKHANMNVSIPMLISRRAYRLTPPVIAVLGFAMLSYHFGSGPEWWKTLGDLRRTCKANAWTIFLFMNNYRDVTTMCMPWTWYVSAELHLHIFGIILLIPIMKFPRFGFSILSTACAVALGVVAVNSIIFKLPPLAVFSYKLLDEVMGVFENLHLNTHVHAVAYVAGMLTAYVMVKRPKQRIPVTVNISAWIASITAALTTIYSLHFMVMGPEGPLSVQPSVAASTIYVCAAKIVWSAGLAWVTFACFTGNGGIVTSILSWSAFVPLGRLTYMAYLLQPVFQLLYVGSTRAVIHANHRTLVFMYLAQLVIAYSAAYVFSMLFEAPFMALEKIVFPQRTPTKTVPNGDTKEAENGVVAVHYLKSENDRSEQKNMTLSPVDYEMGNVPV